MDFYQRFTKIALGIALLGGMLWAEKSGGFFSIEAGLAKASFKQDIDATGHTHPGTNPNTPSQPTPLVGNITADNILPALYLKGGHKFMFGERGRPARAKPTTRISLTMAWVRICSLTSWIAQTKSLESLRVWLSAGKLGWLMARNTSPQRDLKPMGIFRRYSMWACAVC